eukprot:7517948-Karenia_brevis.AAC.1
MEEAIKTGGAAVTCFMSADPESTRCLPASEIWKDYWMAILIQRPSNSQWTVFKDRVELSAEKTFRKGEVRRLALLLIPKR